MLDTKDIIISAAACTVTFIVGFLLGKRVSTLGEGSWDGRTGVGTKRTSTLSGRLEWDNIYGKHVRFKSTDFPKAGIEQLYIDAVKLFQYPPSAPNDETNAFWDKVCGIGKHLGLEWELVIAALKKNEQHPNQWVFRAYKDTDHATTKQYCALEFWSDHCKS